jgi:hypothetical protein
MLNQKKNKMKKNITIILLSLLPLLVIGQVPQAFNYQAVVRDAEGSILNDIEATFFIEILQDGTPVYSEMHTEDSGKTGVVNFKVGEGDDPSSDFAEIDWSQGQYQISVTLDGESNPVGTADIVSVPMALYAQRSGGDNDWIVDNQNVFRTNGCVGIGTTTPRSDLHILDTVNINLTESGGLLIGELDKENIAIDRNEIMARNNGAADRLSLQANGGEIRIHSNDGIPSSNVIIKEDGDIGIGTNSPNARLQIKGFNDANYSNGGGIIVGESGSENLVFDENEIMARDDGEKSSLFLQNNGGNLLIQAHDLYGGESKVGIGTENPETKLHVEGTTKTQILEITGGGDGAEYFNTAGIEKLEKGSLVVIDEENEGKLKTSSSAYDTRIAGVISGAGGVNPGITLKQHEVLEGDELVSLWGRVYVNATTENGKIQPGDFLTSSNTEGHVMKATKKRKSRGAIIGKALSRLDEGEGLVLILIQHQ